MSGLPAPLRNDSMIHVDRLSKRYGSFKAVDGIRFDVGRGEIVGLLGPNGAGKTTTMRMLTTYLSPTSGRATLAGFDVLDDPIEVRRKVGYLAENVPLYPEMRVNEYLSFRSKLKDVARSKRRRVIAEVVRRCQLGEVERRIIGQLSRGFRQRVGLAEAMVHDPQILILDEPTSGLDPIQIREVREMIRELAQQHTILLSTHILSEVEAVCGRVIIIARGRMCSTTSSPTCAGRERSRWKPAARPRRSGPSFRRFRESSESRWLAKTALIRALKSRRGALKICAKP